MGFKITILVDETLNVSPFLTEEFLQDVLWALT